MLVSWFLLESVLDKVLFVVYIVIECEIVLLFSVNNRIVVIDIVVILDVLFWDNLVMDGYVVNIVGLFMLFLLEV